LSEPHREALAHLLYGVNAEGCITLLTGDIGAGKTTICRCLLQQLPANSEVAIILNPRLSILEMLGLICSELKINVPPKDLASPQNLVTAINTHLLDNYSQGKNTALIIDEAQSLDPEVIEQLRLLTNLETETQKLLQIVLIGQPELKEVFDRPEMEQINQRITARYHLGPLAAENIAEYIDYRLFVAGAPRGAQIFEKKAVATIARLSRGVPRLINILCDRAMLGAYLETSEKVTPAILRQAAVELGFKPPSRLAPSLGKWLIPLLVLATLLLPWKNWYQPSGHEEGSVTGDPLSRETVSADHQKIGTVEPRELIQIHPLVESDHSPLRQAAPHLKETRSQ
jgi:general secretion pathway protein A